MSSLDTKSTHSYQRWIQSPEQASQNLPESEWRAIGVSRQEALRELLAPLKEKVTGAVAEFHLYLKHLDQLFSEFVRAQHSSWELQAHYSALCNELRLPAHLATPAAQALLREYVDLVVHPTSVEPSVAEIVQAFGTLKSDLEPHMVYERMERSLSVQRARHHLSDHLRDLGPLRTIESLIDMGAPQADRIFSKLRSDLQMLGSALHPSQAGDSSEEHLEGCLSRLQSSFNSLIEATRGYDSPSAAISSDQLFLADLHQVVQRLYPNLPKPAFEYPDAQVSQLSGLSRDERQAYLVVMRHLDVFSANQAEEQEFAQTARQERDWLLEDMIRRLGVGGTNDLIVGQLSRLSKHDKPLAASLCTLIAESNVRLEEDLIRIQCEAKVEENVARYLASQRFGVQDLKGLVDLFTTNSDLHQCFAKILQVHEFRKDGSIDELREYINTLADVLRDARSLSPILIDSILLSPAAELVNRAGLELFRRGLENLKSSPEALRARELEALVAITAAILEVNFPYGQHVSDQYRVAAQVVVFGLAPQRKDREIDRPVRDCSSIANLVSRNSSAQLSFAIVNDTIQTHLLPHMVVCKNQSESNPVKRRYQLQRTPDDKLLPVVKHLEYIANRALVVKKKWPSSQGVAVKQGQASHAKSKVSGGVAKQSLVDPQERERRELLAKKDLLTRQLASLETKHDEISAKRDEIDAHLETAQQLQQVVARFYALSSRLSSSLRNELSFQEQSSYKDEFDRYCFGKLRELIGFSPFGLQSKAMKAAAKKVTLSDIQELVFDWALERYADMRAVFSEVKSLHAVLCAIEKDLASPLFGISKEATVQARAASTTCLGTASATKPERSAMLSQGLQLIVSPEHLAGLQAALNECRRHVQEHLAEVSSAIELAQSHTIDAQDEKQGQGGGYGGA